MWGTSGQQLRRDYTLQRSTGYKPSGVTTSNPTVAMVMLWKSHSLFIAEAVQSVAQRIDPTGTPAPPQFLKQRFQMISCALPWDCEAKEGGRGGNSISPMVLHQREADRSISLRHPGCAGPGVCRGDIGSKSLVLLVWIKDNFTRYRTAGNQSTQQPLR